MASSDEPFSNAQVFRIEGSNLTSGRDQLITQTTYNITIVASPTGSNFGQLCNREDWEKLLRQMEERAKRKKEDDDGAVPAIDEETPQPIVTPKPITRRLVMYTAVDNARKKLKKAVDIIFTLTPAGATPSGKPWPAIVWKKLSFQPGARRQDLMWYSETGFSTVKEKSAGTLSPDGLDMIVEPKHVAIFEDADEIPIFSSQEEMPMETSSIAILNKQAQPQRFALCIIDRTRPDTDQFLPVIDLGFLSCDDILVCDCPIMLQAYVVRSSSESQERKPVKIEDMKLPLFRQPVNVAALKETSFFRLYSDNSGRIILEL